MRGITVEETLRSRGADHTTNGIRLGITRSVNDDVLIEIDTIGLFTRGRVVGYAHCAPDAAAGVSREFPCDHVAEAGGAFFQRLDGGWFAFAE